MNELAAELQGIHVLVIDDDHYARHFLRSVLEDSGPSSPPPVPTMRFERRSSPMSLCATSTRPRPLPTSSWSDLATCTFARDAVCRPSASLRAAREMPVGARRGLSSSWRR